MLLVNILTEALASFAEWRAREQNRIDKAEKDGRPVTGEPNWQHIEDWFRERLGGDINKLQQQTIMAADAKAKKWTNILQQSSREQTNTEVKEQDRKVVFESDRWLVVTPNTAEAACRYGAGTRWCTTSAGTAQHYMNRGPLYIIYDKKNQVENPKTGEMQPKRFQFHFESGQFMDESDRRINVQSELDNELKKFFFSIKSVREDYTMEFMPAGMKKKFLEDAAKKGEHLNGVITITGEDNINELPVGLQVGQLILSSIAKKFSIKNSSINQLRIEHSLVEVSHCSFNDMTILTSNVHLEKCRIPSLKIVQNSTVKITDGDYDHIACGDGITIGGAKINSLQGSRNRNDLYPEFIAKTRIRNIYLNTQSCKYIAANGKEFLQAENVQITGINKGGGDSNRINTEHLVIGTDSTSLSHCVVSGPIDINSKFNVVLMSTKLENGGHIGKTERPVQFHGPLMIGKSNLVVDGDVDLLSAEQPSSAEPPQGKIIAAGNATIKDKAFSAHGLIKAANIIAVDTDKYLKQRYKD